LLAITTLLLQGQGKTCDEGWWIEVMGVAAFAGLGGSLVSLKGTSLFRSESEKRTDCILRFFHIFLFLLILNFTPLSLSFYLSTSNMLPNQLDSLLGALFQPTYYSPSRKLVIPNHSSSNRRTDLKDVVRVKGTAVLGNCLSNNGVNFLMGLVTSGLAGLYAVRA